MHKHVCGRQGGGQRLNDELRNIVSDKLLDVEKVAGHPGRDVPGVPLMHWSGRGMHEPRNDASAQTCLQPFAELTGKQLPEERCCHARKDDHSPCPDDLHRGALGSLPCNG